MQAIGNLKFVFCLRWWVLFKKIAWCLWNKKKKTDQNNILGIISRRWTAVAHLRNWFHTQQLLFWIGFCLFFKFQKLFCFSFCRQTQQNGEETCRSYSKQRTSHAGGMNLEICAYFYLFFFVNFCNKQNFQSTDHHQKKTALTVAFIFFFYTLIFGWLNLTILVYCSGLKFS